MFDVYRGHSSDHTKRLLKVASDLLNINQSSNPISHTHASHEDLASQFINFYQSLICKLLHFKGLQSYS